MPRPSLTPPGRATPPRVARSDAAAFDAKRQLAGHVAHDLNNYLTAFLGYGELLTTLLASNEKASRFLGEMIRAGERARTFARLLQAFSGRQILDPTRTDLGLLLEELAPAIEHAVGPDVEVAVGLDADLPSVEVDGGQLRFVILTLVEDASRAMNGGGHLRIEVSALDDDPGEDGWVEIVFADTSGRWSAEDRRSYFEPFRGRQTTGDGLGRAAVYGIVDQMGGRMLLEAAPEGGRLLRIQLPACP